MYKFSIWESLLIGACVAPTDPVLASAVSTSALAISQVPARLRHTITAGKNQFKHSLYNINNKQNQD